MKNFINPVYQDLIEFLLMKKLSFERYLLTLTSTFTQKLSWRLIMKVAPILCQRSAPLSTETLERWLAEFIQKCFVHFTIVIYKPDVTISFSSIRMVETTRQSLDFLVSTPRSLMILWKSSLISRWTHTFLHSDWWCCWRFPTVTSCSCCWFLWEYSSSLASSALLALSSSLLMTKVSESDYTLHLIFCFYSGKVQ